MTKTKSTKRSLLMSALALLMCVSMLVGSTFAWFTDSVVSGSNVIKSGNLDIDVQYTLDGKNWNDLDGANDLFQKGLWEPGHTEVVALKISNEGTLALKYAANMNIISETVGTNKEGKDIVLSDILTVSTLTQQANDAYGVGDITLMLAYQGENSVAYENTTSFKAGNVLKADQELFPGDAHYLFVKVDMAETVGNEANAKDKDSVPSINFGINVLATQYTFESDTFGDQYDKDATYGTYIELDAGDDLLAAMASAEKDLPLTIKLNGDVEWTTDGHHGENDITPASSILIDGNGYTITATGSGVTPLGDVEAPMTLKNVTIVDNSESYNESAWELSYLEMGGRVLNCVKVNFVDPITVDSDKATFTGCTFVGHNDKISTSTTQYGVWVSTGDTTFTGCTFTGTRGLKICDQYASEVGTVVVDSCTFKDISEKPGVAIDDRDIQDMKITIKNSTFINCQAGDQGEYVYETDNTVPTVKNNTILNNIASVVEIATKADLFAFAQRVNGGDSMRKTLVRLTNDIDLENEIWTPIGQTGATEFKGIFDGQGYTIKNLNIDSSAQTGEHYSSGLFGWAESGVTIMNVNVDGATVKGNHNVAVIVGYTYSGKISGCHVSNATVTCMHANDDACGDKAGTIAGYTADESRISDCSATNCTVTAGRDAGQLLGLGYNVSVSNCTATNVTVTATGDCTGANINNAIIGRVMG